MNAERPVLELSRAMLSPTSHHGPPNEPPLALTASHSLRVRRTLVLTHAARMLGLCLLAVAVLCGVAFFADANEVAVDCTTLAHWTKRPKPPQVNQAHVFCGEWKQNAPGGFHSRPGGLDPEICHPLHDHPAGKRQRDLWWIVELHRSSTLIEILYHVPRRMLHAASPELDRLRRHPPQPMSGECPALGGLRPESTAINCSGRRPLLCGE